MVTIELFNDFSLKKIVFLTPLTPNFGLVGLLTFLKCFLEWGFVLTAPLLRSIL